VRERAGARASATQQDSTGVRYPRASDGYSRRVFNSFSEDARHVLVLAADEARNLGHDRIGTEHLLLGLVRLGDESTAHLGLTLAGARQDVRSVLGSSTRRTIGELRFTPTAKRALERADAASNGGDVGPSELLSSLLGVEGSGAAELVGDAEIDPEDDGALLLQLASRPDTVTSRALAQLGVDHERLQRAVELVRRR
jgi:ATP-dependent Clp protease ATP-binding subunit ClpA